jgi:hypothetical protein
VDHQAAALWLSKFTGDALTAPNWLRPVAAAYLDWTSTTNGAGLDPSDELSTTATEWNQAYYRLVARSLSGLTASDIDDLCINPVVCLPDKPFLDAMANLLISIDVVYLDVGSITGSDVLRIRTVLVDRMQKTWSWINFERFGDRVNFLAQPRKQRALDVVPARLHGVERIVCHARCCESA